MSTTSDHASLRLEMESTEEEVRELQRQINRLRATVTAIVERLSRLERGGQL